MDTHRGSTDLPEQVHEAELATIDARRRAALGDRAALPHIESSAPTSRRGLVGLAVSGGGIRSATLSFGVLQALVRKDLFRRFDYLSTVSGGGYTGSMLSSLLRDPGDSDRVLAKEVGESESPVLQHLRNGSNYVTPGGIVNTARFPAVMLRGLLLNALQLLPFVLIVVLLTEVVHENRYRLIALWGRASGLVTGFFQATPSWVEWIIAGVVVPLIGYPLLVLASRGSWAHRNQHERAWGKLLIGAVGVVVAIPVLSLTGWAVHLSYAQLETLVAANLTARVWLVILAVCVGVYVLTRVSKDVTTLFSKAALLGAAVLGPGILLAFYLALVIAQTDSPFLRGSYPELAPVVGGASPTSLTLGPALRTDLGEKGVVYAPTDAVATVTVRALWCPGYYFPGVGGAWQLALPGDGPARALPEELCLAPHREVEEVSAALGVPAIRLVPLDEGPFEVWGARLHLGGPRSPTAWMSDTLVFVLALSLFAFNYLFLNVNMSSLHGFYRDRLSKLYVFRFGASGQVEGNDTQPLSELNTPGSIAPYHILNATLNMQGDDVESARGRDSDFFIFSKHFCGGPHARYCRTTDLEDVDPHLDLGTAMAISGAAAGPNMGAMTQRAYVFVMAMLNLRMAYWLPNPGHVRDHGIGTATHRLDYRPRVKALRYRPRVGHLLDEALGRLNATTPLVNVSDGGHLENLAIYELLRRRCRLIVAIDGEADPDLTFHGLVTVIRLAGMDLGVTIEMENLQRLRWNDRHETEAHFTTGTIDYGADGRGTLIYVKSTVTGDENPYIQRYRADHPAFPHEPTSDQFFDETQFEVYRALGEHIGGTVAERFAEELAVVDEKQSGPDRSMSVGAD